MSAETATDAQDLDDPLYGNANDETEKVCSLAVYCSMSEMGGSSPNRDCACGLITLPLN